MKKYELIEAIINELGGGSASADVKERFRPGIVKIHAGVAFDDLVVRVYQNSDNASKSDLDAYAKWYSITSIVAADTTGMKYVQIPTIVKRLLQIPNNKAIRRIMTKEAVTSPVTSTKKCLYRDWGMQDVYSQLEADAYLAVPRYFILGENIYLDSKIGTATGLDVLMVVPFSEWDDDEDLPAPLENNPTIIEYVVSKFRNAPPDDKIMDDNLQQD